MIRSNNTMYTRLLPFFIICCMFAAVVSFPVAAQQSVPVPVSSVPVSQTTAMQTLMLSDLNGNAVPFSRWHGKVVYIKFWATWCPLCLAGLEDFSHLAQQYNTSDTIRVISVVAPGVRGEVSKEDFIEWAAAQQIDFPVFLDDAAGSVNRAFNIVGYPSSLYLDTQGKVIKKSDGDESNESIIATLSAIVQNPVYKVVQP